MTAGVGDGQEVCRISLGCVDRGSDFSHAFGRNLLRDEADDFCRVCLLFAGDDEILGLPASPAMAGMEISGSFNFCEAAGVGICEIGELPLTTLPLTLLGALPAFGEISSGELDWRLISVLTEAGCVPRRNWGRVWTGAG